MALHRQSRPFPSRSPYITTPRPWQPLSDEELIVLWPYFVHKGSGRPIFDIRARLDAIFWCATHNGPWKDLPPAFGHWDTAHRQFRRWAHKGVWTQLLKDVATTKNPVLAGLKHWLCRAFRRAWRMLGLEAVRLARRLGLHSALRGPIWMMPDPDLSENLWPHVKAALDRATAGSWKDPWVRQCLRAGMAFHKLVGGALHIPRRLAPP